MNKDETLSHKEQRINLWANAWVHTASASDCKSFNTATKWADEALKAFDERFPMPKEPVVETPKE
jgi:hypothetical protein